MINPTGYFVLVETDNPETKSSGGVIMVTADTAKRMDDAVSTGYIKAFGPMAFKGLSCGCNSPAEWGIAIGDKVEFLSYDGKRPQAAGRDTKLRLITDQHIICKVG
jgi:co-chaperonin GroES (HSP10)